MMGLNPSTAKFLAGSGGEQNAKVKKAVSLDCVGGSGSLTWQRIC
jgi:hypothetical protein